MTDPHEDSFRKRSSCPDAETLLAHNSGALSFLAREQVSTHLLACDFCRACTQLLSDRPPPEATAPSGPRTPREAPPEAAARMPLSVLMVALARTPFEEGAARAGLTRAA